MATAESEEVQYLGFTVVNVDFRHYRKLRRFDKPKAGSEAPVVISFLIFLMTGLELTGQEEGKDGS